jgi:NAD(P)-dependent dehydrogenase (short-subunit alcohol dehydrogenase family)
VVLSYKHNLLRIEMRLSGKTIVITGASSGLGSAALDLLIAKGARILAIDLNQDLGKQLADKYGEQVVCFVAADVCDEQAVAKAIAKAVEKFGGVHGLVNCAGVGKPVRVVAPGSGKVHPQKDFEWVVKINLFGSFNVLRLVCAQIAKQEAADSETGEKGVVINTASVAAFDGQIGQASYSASKAAIAGMTLPLARDLGAIGVRVNTIAPGIFDTPMLAALPDKARKSLMKQVPFPPRLGDPKEFAALCVHVFENSYLNGETIRLDGSIRMAAL